MLQWSAWSAKNEPGLTDEANDCNIFDTKHDKILVWSSNFELELILFQIHQIRYFLMIYKFWFELCNSRVISRFNLH